ncbi:4Fe-4S dicluster domain-containing protein [Oceanidesulfovibrio marinus]|uniref:4Fe-4S dicluster domain-containing protein n=1 Tax=Oceanidesulfovibrio marinus TaxID=370038 RepID=A0ABX6NHW8_9BACT|nr:4Fe-4S dicluster domain-containing protein [Oceanidesulfovibrio marinus]
MLSVISGGFCFVSRKKSTISRRSFLRGAAIAGVGAPALARAGAQDAKGEELATLLDISKCVGCGACVVACGEANESRYPKPEKPFPEMFPPRVKVADWSDDRYVDDRLTPYNWLFVDNITVNHEGTEHEIHMPRRCMHCTNPPCANLCPWGAAAKKDDGAVVIDPDVCLGGSKCKSVCPWDIPQRQTGVGLYLDLLPRFAGNGVMFKCDRCQPRMAEGKLPACIEACPMQVQQIGPRSEIIAKAKALAAEMNGYIYGLEENGGTNTIYVSPVPFEKLEQARAKVAPSAGKKGKGKHASKGKNSGRPNLTQVGSPFEKEDMFAAAVFTAPVAGLAAGAIRLLRKTQSGHGEDS